ncbi:MAG: SH3 domain-containing protein [Nitrososphaerales archaeon]
MKKHLLILAGFAAGGYAFGTSAGAAYERGWIPETVIKLVEKYYQLSEKVEELEKRVQKLEQGGKSKDRTESDEPVKEKVQAKLNIKVRFCPSFKCGAVSMLEKGEVASVLEKRDRWTLVETQYGVRGWVYSKYLQAYSF